MKFISGNNTDKENKQIDLFQKIDLEYVVPSFTKKVIVEENSRPHSHLFLP